MARDRREQPQARNVLGKRLQSCSHNPKTGFFRDGCCNTDESDRGRHIVCVQVTEEFLEFSKSVGNDLSTPIPEYQFAGLKEGDSWCLCALRWYEAYQHGKAPKVHLEATHEMMLQLVPLDVLQTFSID